MTQIAYQEKQLTQKFREKNTKERIKNEGGKFIKFNRNKRTVHYITATGNKKVEGLADY